MFLLVPAHPGCPGQIPQSRKMVVCVCVCVIVVVLIKKLAGKNISKMTHLCRLECNNLISQPQNWQKKFSISENQQLKAYIYVKFVAPTHLPCHG